MIQEKICSLEQLRTIIDQKKSEGKTVVFTNGCFDILHSGHVEYLEDASKKGDLLVVAINSDFSVKQIKGPGRPINSEKNRIKVVAALESVAYAICFDQPTPYQLISEIIPNVLVKGGDWAVQDIVGNDIVIDNGGIVESIPFREGFSTTDVINKIRNSTDE